MIAVEPCDESIRLWDDTPPFSSQTPVIHPYLDVYFPKERARTSAVLILPGGGYENISEFEGAPFARAFANQGFTALVLRYRYSPIVKHPGPLADLCRALRIIRSRAEVLGIDPNKIIVVGSSAGGHLAASAATLGHTYMFTQEDSLASFSNIPNALILCYPVITLGQFSHQPSVTALLGDAPPQLRIDELSLEKQVTPKTPPTFIWHTSDDAIVPVQNSLLFAEALFKAKVNCSLHIYPTGYHGMALAENDPVIKSWFGLALDWLSSLGF